MAMLLKGAQAAAAMNEKTAARVARLEAAGVRPTLAVVRVGERPDDLSYEKGVMNRCSKLGIQVQLDALPADATQEELLAVLDRINRDAAVHGCLLFRPLPPQMEDGAIRAALGPEKDVDGITDASLAGVFTGSGVGYPPCTAQACVEILEHYGISLEGRRVTVVGRSLVVGKPAAMLLDRKNATVTICNSRTQGLEQLCRQADVLVVAMGRRGAIGSGCFAPGQAVVDVGIHTDEAGKLCGDVRFDEAEPVVAAITPVPGGVGAMTTSVLAAHVVEAAARASGL
ncbi:bifunctional 5,10-methylene-tetrahydrofolate dehydrogenase/5,10-methylene-tetrahydrofolate cyclohydrolase [Faecalibacterium sp. An58]|uniref:bifunctional 5,10-methylenetetrahydrofolate dehydrogenase/5,10-methenyltetrahydrofolate cyclohydrolase n=1 Tax=Faecalibacterium sp. An58 TaxID=1965648 RepID=UPI000B385E2D|nr:tetrahydrofolate dehydrogenase/cyclohydrolase catalytic domain-containing protein [Faecalibacterium sp. An58]OUN74523.1 bifunctional 5,10-methylene-tetrahydrofolate dehydrogenase/5,10-methylene-tetrahydrofolate cyclohydrolase [Faecalibacterium sp. An58]